MTKITRSKSGLSRRMPVRRTDIDGVDEPIHLFAYAVKVLRWPLAMALSAAAATGKLTVGHIVASVAPIMFIVCLAAALGVFRRQALDRYSVDVEARPGSGSTSHGASEESDIPPELSPPLPP
jgi:hypothetical protein